MQTVLKQFKSHLDNIQTTFKQHSVNIVSSLLIESDADELLPFRARIYHWDLLMRPRLFEAH